MCAFARGLRSILQQENFETMTQFGERVREYAYSPMRTICTSMILFRKREIINFLRGHTRIYMHNCKEFDLKYYQLYKLLEKNISGRGRGDGGLKIYIVTYVSIKLL